MLEERWVAATPTITIDGVTLQRDTDLFDVPIVIDHLVLSDVHNRLAAGLTVVLRYYGIA